MNRYYFIKKFDQSHIDKQDKKTIIIFRNYSQAIDEKSILTIKNYCKKNIIPKVIREAAKSESPKSGKNKKTEQKKSLNLPDMVWV